MVGVKVGPGRTFELHERDAATSNLTDRCTSEKERDRPNINITKYFLFLFQFVAGVFWPVKCHLNPLVRTESTR